MKMPYGDKAEVSDAKLLNYILNTSHSVNRAHAELFLKLLEIDRLRAVILRAALLHAAATAEALPGKPSPFGDKYEIRFPMTGPAWVV